jgi:glycosyltransferase involved in cell wall biosynthesis
MKICLIGNPRSILIKKWVEFYNSQNHEVHIINIDNLRKFKEDLSIPDATVHRVFFFSYSLLKLQTIINLIQLLKIIKKINPDLLHVHYISYQAWLVALTGFRPLIVSAWGSDIYIDANNLKQNRQWAEYAINKSDMVVTTSKTLRKYIIDNYEVHPEKISRFYWGQDLNVFKRGYKNDIHKLKLKLNLDDNHFVVLSSRNMKQNYGIKYIIDCIPYVIKKKTKVKFIFLRGSGSIEFENQLKKLVDKLKISKYVIFVSKYLSSEELAVYDNLADVVISLPISDQFSGVVKEGMACGAIPIVHDLEVYHEHLEDGENGFLVDREKSEEVANKIIYCIDNHPELKEKFAKINRKILEEESDWNKNKFLMIKLYKKILKRIK